MSISRAFFVTLFLLGSLFQAKAQRITAPGQVITCNGSDVISNTRVINELINSSNNNARLETESDFEFEFINPSGGVTNVMLAAGAIWSEVIETDVPIKVLVTWVELSEGVLGSARPSSRESNFDEAPVKNVWYAIALAEKLAGRELNEDDEYEINISLNSERQWYYGLDGMVAEDSHDLLSVALHEIGHGLGLSDTYDVDGGSGSWGWNGRPNIYDLFIHNNKEQPLVYSETFANYTAALGSQLTSNSVIFKSEYAQAVNETTYPRIYSPAEFNGGSSISHLDESSFPPGDINSLMSPQLGREEAIHKPGPIIKAILADMGYVNATISHDSIPDYPDFSTAVNVTGFVTSDSALDLSSGKLIYSEDEFLSEKIVSLEFESDNSSFTAIIPPPSEKSIIQYYFEVSDNTGKVYRSPARTDLDNYEFGFGIITSVEDDISGLEFYPNPVSERLWFQLETTGIASEVSITDMNGNTLKTLIVNNSGSIDVSDLVAGLYVLKVSNNSATSAYRLVIQ